MNGAEHYREAEKLLSHAEINQGFRVGPEQAARAQAHATLALAAAVAQGTVNVDEITRSEWLKVISDDS